MRLDEVMQALAAKASATTKREESTASKAVLEKPQRRGRLSCMRCV